MKRLIQTKSIIYAQGKRVRKYNSSATKWKLLLLEIKTEFPFRFFSVCVGKHYHYLVCVCNHNSLIVSLLRFIGIVNLAG